ncbi:MAG: preprotein translocase subunit YajC [Gemmatimonadota bacterium]
MTFALLNVMSNADGKMPGWFLPFQILLIVGIFYFLIIRPQGAARKKHAQMLTALKKGDEVMTAGGIVGKVKDVKEVKDKAEWRVTIETGESTVVVERSRIIRVGDTAAPPA